MDVRWDPSADMGEMDQVLANMNFSRYSSAVLVVAKEEVCRAFQWLFLHQHPKDPNLYVGDYLQLTEGGIRRIKGGWERTTLKRRDDPIKMDISLLYQLLQHTCGLAPETPDFTWKDPPGEGEEERLEHWLYRVKEIRNELSHEYSPLMFMCDQELATRLTTLTHLLCSIVDGAGRRSKRPQEEVEEAVGNVKDKMHHLHTSIPQSGIRSHEFALLAKEELAKQWKGCTTWNKQLYPIVLRWAVEGREVALNQLLMGLGDEPAQVIVVLGEPGCGKSSLCQQLLDGWLHGDPQYPEVVGMQLVVWVRCRDIFTKDLTQLMLDDILPDATLRMLPEEVPLMVRTMKVLWLIDGFEEATRDARDLVGRLVARLSNHHVVLLTGNHDYLAEVGTTLAHATMQVHHVTHCGLADQGFRSLLADLLGERADGEGTGEPQWGERCTAFAQEVSALSPVLMEELHNPLKLTLAVKLWEEGLLKEAGAPLTRLYTTIQDALVAKLAAKLRAKTCLTEAEAGDRVRRWVAALCREAMMMWAKGAYMELEEASEQRLKDRAVELMLIYTDCFSTFLVCVSRPSQPARHSFLHHTQQSVMAAQHLHRLLLEGVSIQELKVLMMPKMPVHNIMDHFTGVLIQAATSLAADGKLEEETAGVVAALLDKCRLCQWLVVVQRTGCSPALAREAHRRLAGKWKVTDATVEAAAALIKIGPPDVITIQINSDPKKHPQLLPLLQCLGESSAEVRVKAYHCFLYGFEPGVPLYSTDHLLQPLCKPKTDCCLMEYVGLLTAEGCRALHLHQETVRTLFVGVMDHEGLDHLIQLSHESVSLESLHLHLLCSLRVEPQQPVARRVEVSLSLMKVDEGEAKLAVGLIRRISHTFWNITLNHVMPATACKMLKAFKELKVRAHSLGRWTRLRFMDNIELCHLPYFPLPPPQEIAPRFIYKKWNNPDIKLWLTIRQAPKAPYPSKLEYPYTDNFFY